MNDQLNKLFNEFCALKDAMNSGNVNDRTVDIISRLGKAVRNAENIVLEPPVKEVKIDIEHHAKISTYMPAKEVPKVTKVVAKKAGRPKAKK